jgi:hypothetical protein
MGSKICLKEPIKLFAPLFYLTMLYKSSPFKCICELRNLTNFKFSFISNKCIPVSPVAIEGESELDFRFRAERVFHLIINEYREYKRVAIVSHGGLISNFIKSFLHLPTINGCSLK